MKKIKRGRAAPMARKATREELAKIAAGEDKAFDLKTLKQQYGVRSDTCIYQWVADGILPRPVRIGGCSRWLASHMVAT